MQKHIRQFSIILFLCCITLLSYAQKITVSADYVIVDSTFDYSPNSQAQNILNEYKSIVDKQISRKIGESAQNMEAAMPESLLTNLACDILYEKGAEILKEPVDLSLLNIGGFRASLPKGDVTLSNLYNIFPFDNTVQITFIKGKYLRQLFMMFAEKQMQPMSHVTLKIHNKNLQEALIGGKALNDDKVYKLVTIDFLILGGDGMILLEKAERYIPTQLILRDVIAEHFIEKYKKGIPVDANMDRRVIFE